jgi:hypothetical protein
VDAFEKILVFSNWLTLPGIFNTRLMHNESQIQIEVEAIYSQHVLELI